MSYSVRPNSVDDTIHQNQKIPVGSFVEILPRTRTVKNDFGGRFDLLYRIFNFIQQY